MGGWGGLRGKRADVAYGECEDCGDFCTLQCGCGRGHFPSCKYSSCYICYLDRRADLVTCILCGSRWHDPLFDTCYSCSPHSQGRDDAAKALRQLIFHRDGHVCASCGIKAGEMKLDPRLVRASDDGWRPAAMHVDHIIPCRHGGRADEWNLQILCMVCNIAKGARWYQGCPYEAVRDRMAFRYRLIKAAYWNPDDERRIRFEREVALRRETGTWDPKIQRQAAAHIAP